MTLKYNNVFIGMPGFSYNFKNIKDYTQEFNIVEINTTFYHTPSEDTFIKWFNDTPNNFKFIIKIPRTITHLYKLNNFNALWDKFYQNICLLKNKLHGVLFQFPLMIVYF
jgi:uncharacterized protein YecE (DUF72 family)